MVKKEVIALLSNPRGSKSIITKEILNSLPSIVQKWLTHSGVEDKEKIQFLRRKQKGEIQTKPDGRTISETENIPEDRRHSEF